MELKDQLKAHRSRLGISQEELAERIYVSRQTISNWETDRTYPDVQSLLLLSDVFDTSIDELVKGDVETMENKIEKEWKKMSRLSGVAWGLIVAGVGCFVLGLKLPTAQSSIFPNFTEGGLLGLVAFVLLWLFGMQLLSMVEHMKKANDIVTYRDILAFSKGEEPVRDEHAFSRRKPLLAKVLLFVCAALIGAVIGIAIAHFL